MPSQVAFPYTFPFIFHTGERVDNGVGVDSSELVVSILRGEYGVGDDSLSALLAIILGLDSGAGLEAINGRDFVAYEAGLASDISSLEALLVALDAGAGIDSRVVSLLSMFLLQVYLPNRNLTTVLGVRKC